MNRGEVWWAHAPSGARRPHLVLTRDAAIPLLTAVVAVPATRTVRGLPSEVELTEEEGMPADCALTLDNVTLMPVDRLERWICTLSAERLDQVCRALRHATDC